MTSNIQPKKPRALVCYICGKEYGTKRIENHIANCAKKWDADQLKYEPEERKPCPQAPPGFLNVIRMTLGKEPISEADEQQLPTLKNILKEYSESDLMKEAGEGAQPPALAERPSMKEFLQIEESVQ